MTCLHCGFERLSHQVAGGVGTLATGITRKAKIFASIEFILAHFDFVGIDDDHVVAAVKIGGEVRFVLSTKDFSHFGAKTTKNLICSVNYDPLLLDSSGSC